MCHVVTIKLDSNIFYLEMLERIYLRVEYYIILDCQHCSVDVHQRIIEYRTERSIWESNKIFNENEILKNQDCGVDRL